MDSHNIFDTLKGDLQRIEQELEENLISNVPLISHVGKHILLSGGKRLRPLLFLLCARLCGHTSNQAGLSSIFEYLHAATLLHDDVVDSAEIRRGKSSANALWGNSASVLVGDFLLAKSFSLAVNHGHYQMLKVLSDTATKMAEGEVLELVHSYNYDINEAEYFRIITDKTAVLISAACHIGAVLGNVPKEREDALASFGLNLGIAFQLVDDALDYTSTVEEFGKPVGNDLKEGKITLPLIYTLAQLNPAGKNQLLETISLSLESDGDFRKVAQWVENHGGIPYTVGRARYYRDLAKKELGIFEESSTKSILMNLADFVVERRV